MYRLLSTWKSFEVIAEQVWILYSYPTAISINIAFGTQYSGKQDPKSLELKLLCHLVFFKVFLETHKQKLEVFFPPLSLCIPAVEILSWRKEMIGEGRVKGNLWLIKNRWWIESYNKKLI